MSGLGNVLTGFIGGAAGGIVAIGGVKRLRERREAVRRRKETPDAASEEPAHTGSPDTAELSGAAPAGAETQYMIGSMAARLAEAEANLAAAATALSAQEARLARFEARFDRVMGGSAPLPGVTADREEPVVAFATFLREIDETGFDPEARGATAEQRAAYRAAREAADRAESWLGRTGDADRARQIHAAVGEGRRALIRLDALLKGRPVPLAYTDPGELSGAVDAAATPYTGDRFGWEGEGANEFLLDRPEHGRPVLLEVRRGTATDTVLVVQSEKTDRTVRQVTSDYMGLDGSLVLYLMVPPMVTHIAVQGRGRWTVNAVDTSRLPKDGGPLSGVGAAVFRHRSGRSKVTLQGTDSANFQFYKDCKCSGVCKIYEHSSGTRVAAFTGAFRQDVVLPGGRGVIVVQTAGARWSVDPLGDR
jgi:hypothetical protein